MGPKENKVKTPVKMKEQDQRLLEGFVTVKVSESPSASRKGNLTGSARKLKDGAADLYNLIQKWRSLNAEGSNLVSGIANIKLEAVLSQNEDREMPVDLLPESLLPLCDKLENLVKKLGKISSKLCGLAEMALGIAQLETYGASENSGTVLFQTWNLEKFVTAFREIAEMYQEELKLKRCIQENICHAPDRNTIMFYSAAWIHEPYIEQRADLHLESMLLETGHKT